MVPRIVKWLNSSELPDNPTPTIQTSSFRYFLKRRNTFVCRVAKIPPFSTRSLCRVVVWGGFIGQKPQETRGENEKGTPSQQRENPPPSNTATKHTHTHAEKGGERTHTSTRTNTRKKQTDKTHRQNDPKYMYAHAQTHTHTHART